MNNLKQGFYRTLFLLFATMSALGLMAQDFKFLYTYTEFEFIQGLKDRGVGPILIYKSKIVGYTSFHADADGEICRHEYDMFVKWKEGGKYRLKKFDNCYEYKEMISGTSRPFDLYSKKVEKLSKAKKERKQSGEGDMYITTIFHDQIVMISGGKENLMRISCNNERSYASCDCNKTALKWSSMIRDEIEKVEKFEVSGENAGFTSNSE